MPKHDWPIEHDAVTGCWLWLGAKNALGYPKVFRKGAPLDAHRLVYESERGAVPEGKELDHTCKRRHCVAPHHLEPVSRTENVRLSGRKGWGRRIAKQACSQGHDLWLYGIRTEQGGRVCGVCSGVRSLASKG